MIVTPFRGEPPLTVRQALSQKRWQTKVDARIRHRAYSFGFADALRLWRWSSCYADCWGMGRDGPVERRWQRKPIKRRYNLARFRIDVREIPF